MSFEPGSELKLSEYICFRSDKTDISSLVKLSLDELKQLEQESIKQEETIYSRIVDTVQEWRKQANTTLNLRKAQEYLKAYPINHTSNQCILDECDWYEISNMVYKFRWHVNEKIRWDRSLQKNVSVAWEVSWYLTFNIPHSPGHSGRQIAGQRGKKFSDKVSLEQYLQGRINAYAHLFTEISPPIPETKRRQFCVNGVLLPGYTVETPQLTQPDPNTVDDLLSYLDDDDMPSFQQPEEPPAPAPSKAAAKKKSAPKKSGPVR